MSNNFIQQKNSAGFSLIEVILSIALFSLVVAAFTGAIIYAQQTAVIAGKQERASLILEEGLEVARNIRDSGFNNLQDGQHGLAINNGSWSLSGSSDITDIFNRSVNIVSTSTSTKDVTVTVTWDQDFQRAGSLSANTILTNWKGE